MNDIVDTDQYWSDRLNDYLDDRSSCSYCGARIDNDDDYCPKCDFESDYEEDCIDEL